MKPSSDVIIIGAGIIGCSMAYRLAKERLKVTIIERGQPGEEASSAAAGMLTPQSEAVHGSTGPFSQLCLASLNLYPDFVAELQEETGVHIPYGTSGSLYLATDFVEATMLEGLLRRQEAAGLPAEELTAQQVRELEPMLAETVQVGLYLSGDHHVDNRVLMKALVTAAMRRGVEFLTGTPVIGLAWDDGRVVGVRTPGHTLAGGLVINAAGCWAGLVDQTHNLQIPTKPVRGQIVQLQQSRQSLHHLIHWAGTYLVPWPDGRTLVGSTLENVGYNKSVTAGGIRQLLDAALKIAPPLQHAIVQKTWAGLRPGTPDDLPILGQSRVPNLVIAAGHFRNGILLAPITAKLIAELILTGNSSIPLDPFSPERFDEQ